ncbi:TPA: 23S ribosomal RNA methyltransferase Erm [Candidatus Dojkabacteria bacterium]|uniref:23S ribosomal RNA methyltransferase Erm n=1 Tax=Candidatus Dojkabacteria bacterium TaxID=2099670 RepID=A0A832QCQ4_9BACT|nr:23S ribosomal RNA methyltransferase Erm [Candidatus Dojkabacteria bacterium]
MTEVTRTENKNLWHSQNFLHDSQFVKSLIAITNIGQDDTVVEIGPGKGIITAELSKQANKIIAIELDSTLAEELRKKFIESKNIEIIETDFLKWPNPKFKYKVFSNIPFEYTSRIMDKLLLSPNSPEDTYLIMQDLAAKRYIGSPLGNNSQISSLLQPFYEMSILTNIDRKQYKPIPNVDTVLAQFHKREQPLVDKKLEQDYRDFVIYGYNQWKPTILQAYDKVLSYKQQTILEKNLHIKNKKPSELNIDEWISLFKTYMQYVSEEKKNLVRGSEKLLRSKQKNIEKRYKTRR